jgi:subtilase family serine protease
MPAPVSSRLTIKGTINMRNIVTGGLLAALVALGLGASANAQPQLVEQWGKNTFTIPACKNIVGLVAHCVSHIVTDSTGKILTGRAPIGGLDPAELRSAYNITQTGSASTIIAIVDAWGYPNAESDLATYRAEWGLPACTTENGCFKKLNEHGRAKNYPPTNSGWDLEQALDLDMASAMCPGCTIYLIEANNATFTHLGKSVSEAAALGAHVISNSYCGTEVQAVKKYETYYNHAGVAVTAANGDDGYGVCAPADMDTVVAVGGTHLTTDNNARGWNETVWSGTGSGCSTVFKKPTWQTDTGCAKRTIGDTSGVADPATGVAVYDAGWHIVGGTSVATPLVGGIFAVNGGTVNAASTIYAAPATDLNDVTTGSNGTCSPAYLCNGEVGYDGPTGMGTPNGIGAYGN